jgi:hypothetical protein
MGEWGRKNRGCWALSSFFLFETCPLAESTFPGLLLTHSKGTAPTWGTCSWKTLSVICDYLCLILEEVIVAGSHYICSQISFSTNNYIFILSTWYTHIPSKFKLRRRKRMLLHGGKARNATSYKLKMWWQNVKNQYSIVILEMGKELPTQNLKEMQAVDKKSRRSIQEL